jgi:hypothetical protein
VCGNHLLVVVQKLAEPLKMHNLPLPQELYNLIDIRVVGQAQNVVVGGAGFLLWYYLVLTARRKGA